MERMRYPFVLFDVGETLVGPRDSFGAVYARVLGGLGLRLPADRLESSLREVWQEIDRAIPLGRDRYGHWPGGEQEYWLRFARRTIEKATNEPLKDGFALRALERLREAFRDPNAWRVYPDVPPALDELQAMGTRLGVVSNWDSRLPGILEMLGLAERFEAVVVSHLEGIEKPDPALFRSALERLGARPEQALHVGDVPELDLEGARAAGVDGLLVDRRGRFGPELEAVENLAGLPRIVREGLDPAGRA